MARALVEASSENHSFGSNARQGYPRGMSVMQAQLPRSSAAARRGQLPSAPQQVSLYAPISSRQSRGPRLSNEVVAHPRHRRLTPCVLSDITNTGRDSLFGSKPAMGTGKAAASATGPATCSLVKPSSMASSVSQGTGSTCASATSSTRATDMEIDDLPDGGGDPQGVAEYASDIYTALGREESNFVPRPNYMEFQSDINAKMRAILVDWLIEVHVKYNCKSDNTLYLAVNIIDRFLDKQPLVRKKLQLCGVTSMLIAAKFEEIFPPEIRDLVYITDNGCTKDEILQMEVAILTALQFNLCVPITPHFAERYQRANDCTEEHRHLVQYLLELTLPEIKMVKYTPSHLAAAAVFLSNKLLRLPVAWPPTMVEETQLSEAAIKGCAREMCGLLEGAGKSHLQAVRIKFSSAKYSRVAKQTFV